MLAVVHGRKGSGKTTAVLAAARGLQARDVPVTGFASPRTSSGYDLVDLGSGERLPLVRKGESGSGWVTYGPPELPDRFPYLFSRKALERGGQILSAAARDLRGVLAVDEVGTLELAGEGFPGALNTLKALAARPGRACLLAVRDVAFEEVMAFLGLVDGDAGGPVRSGAVCVRASRSLDADALANLLASRVGRSK